MNTEDMKKAAKYSEIAEAVEKLNVSEFHSIVVGVTLHTRRGPDEGQIAIRISPDDPRYAALEALVLAEAADQKAKAEAELAKMGLTVVVKKTAIDEAKAESLAAKAVYEDHMERRRLKKIADEAVAAAKK